MRFLSFHCEYFKYTTTKKSRSKIIEELTQKNRSGNISNTIVLFISFEKKDENHSSILEKCIEEIKAITNQLKVKNIVLLSFAHLFGELSTPEFGYASIKKLEEKLKEKGFMILRPPFGWFNELELKAKGHPLSRISRKIQ
ncbi:MAG: threonyl-tRNA synthetase editing domain-containing protein [Promethearchaeota archaeon]